MLLSEVLLVLLLALATLVVPLRVAALRLPSGPAGEWTSAGLSAAFVLAFVVLMATRSVEFGVDTAAYLEVYRGYCARGRIADEELSFLVATWVLNASMLGACEPALLPAVWGGLIAAAVLLVAGPWRLRVRFAGLLLFSLIGIELATNALRQGLSVAVMVLAVSLWDRSRAASVLLAGAAALLHPSAVLIFAALLIAVLPWPRFGLMLVIAVGGVAFAVQNGLQLLLLEPFLYEVQKYLAHEGDEIYIRALSFASVAGAVAAPLMSRRPGQRLRDVWTDPGHATATRLAVTCLPFLALPYFGYRYVYAVYPVVLLLTLMAASRLRLRHGRHFALLALLNAAILLVWAQGSSYMQEVPFYG